jgi:hypothetical protein
VETITSRAPHGVAPRTPAELADADASSRLLAIAVTSAPIMVALMCEDRRARGVPLAWDVVASNHTSQYIVNERVRNPL